MYTTTPRLFPGKRLLIATTALLACWSAGSVAGEQQPPTFRMMAIENLAGGDLVTEGRYAEAIEKITARRVSASDFAAHNNLCVAYVKTKALDKAAAACEAAIELRSRDADPGYLHSAVVRQKLRDRAIALSNRGVLRAITGDVTGARDDFEKSAKLADDIDEPLINLDRLSAGL